MALGTLSLSTTQGVQGRRFAAKIAGLTTGRVELGLDEAPGFYVSNGLLYSDALPYPTSTVSLIEYDPGAAVSRKETRIDITAASPFSILQQAVAVLGAGRTLVSFSAHSTRQADGSTAYSLYVRDDLGAVAVSAIGGSTTPLPFLPSSLASNVGDYSAATITPISGKVAAWSDRSAMANVIANATAASQPTYSSARAIFAAGSSTFLTLGRTSTATPTASTSIVTVPDGAGSDTGKGATSTGLCRARFNRWWIGNHGKNLESTQGSTAFTASVVLANNDFTKAGEITLASLGVTQGSIQGVAEAPDGSIYVAVVDTNQIHHIQPTYDGGNNLTGATLLGSITVTGVNGLAWDSDRNGLWWCGSDTGTYPNATLINPVTGAAIVNPLTGAGWSVTLPASNTMDQLFYSDGFLWCSYGGNGSDGTIRRVDISQNYVREGFLLTGTIAVEGIWIENGTLYVASDEHYHISANLPNVVRTYPIAVPVFPKLGSVFTLAMTLRLAAAPSATTAVATFGEPLTATKPGFGVFLVDAQAGQIRVAAKNVTLTWTLATALTGATPQLLRFVVDGTGNVECFQNGTSLGVQSSAAFASLALPRLPLVVGANVETNALARNASVEIGAIAPFTGALSTTDAQRVEASIAWADGDPTLLPASNPNKAARP